MGHSLPSARNASYTKRCIKCLVGYQLLNKKHVRREKKKKLSVLGARRPWFASKEKDN